MDDIVIIGFGGHAKSVTDSILKAKQYRIVGYTDVQKCCCNYTYLGTDSEMTNIFRNGVRKAALGVGFMGNSSVRDKLVQLVKEIGYELPIIVDPSAVLAEDAKIGEGTFIGKNAIVNSDSIVGNYCIVNTGAIVEHDNTICDFSHVAVGAKLCGNITIGHHSFIGAGTVIIQGLSIGSNCIIGAGSTVLSNVTDNEKRYGVIKG